MVSRKIWLAFLTIIFVFVFIFLTKSAKACKFYTDIPSCTADGQPIIEAYEFGSGWFTGCVMGYYAGKLGDCTAGTSSTCTNCITPWLDKWYTSGRYNGQICKREDGWYCDVNIKEGKYDLSEGKCVICDGYVEKEWFKCGGDYTGDGQCESACGASSACDEKSPNTDLTQCSCGASYFADRCDSNCGCVDRGDNICRSSAFASDCTADSRCNGYQPGQQGGCPSGYTCNNNCQCEAGQISWTISVSPSNAGTACLTRTSDGYSYGCTSTSMSVNLPAGTQVRLSATAGTYYTFKCFGTGGTCQTYTNPVTFTASASGSIYAYFDCNPSTCTGASDTDGGRVYTTQGTCTRRYCSGSTCVTSSYTDYCVSTGTCSGTSYCAQATDEWVCYEMGCWYWDGSTCHPTCEELTDSATCQYYGCTWTPGSSNQLVEYYVSGSSCAAETVTCQGGCSNGACVSCSGCLIGGTCYQNGAVNPNNPCQYCDVSRSTTSWSNYADGTACTKDCGGYTAYCLSGVCTCRYSCRSNSECIAGYCCEKEVDPSKGNCSSSGTIMNYGGKSYLCDPPEWGSESLEVNEEKNQTIFDLIFNFFRSLLG